MLGRRGAAIDMRLARLDAVRFLLSNRQFEAMRMYEWEGMTQRDIGDELGITRRGVESLLRRGRRRADAVLAAYKHADMAAQCGRCARLNNDGNICEYIATIIRLAAKGVVADIRACTAFKDKEEEGTQCMPTN